MILSHRKVVFLQGPSSRFFAQAAEKCREFDAQTLRIGVAPGDRLYWPRRAGRYLPFRGRPVDFPAFLQQLIRTEAPTDFVMLGDGRPYHRMTIDVLAGMRAENPAGGTPTPWIIEHGYLRPGILVESWGMGGRSQIPRAFAARTLGATTDAAPPLIGFPSSFLRYGALDMGYHLANLAGAWTLYPHYRPYAADGPVREYAGWAIKALTLPRRRRAALQAAAQIAAHQGPLFLFPLQLAGDYQIRNYGTGESLSQILDRVIASFARHAPGDALLVVRQHPLDNGLSRWGDQVRATAAAQGVGARVVFQDGGPAEPVLARASGMVTVNSTMGLEAVLRGLPCQILGRAIYGLPGLVSFGPLEQFWTDPTPPDPALATEFADFLRRHYQIAGSFDGPGAEVGARNLAQRLAAPPPPVFEPLFPDQVPV